jgi:phosphoribosylaminoimidazole-succinocarboxamide synthase
MIPPVITETGAPGLTPVMRGKVRDIYDLGETCLLVATDRLSAFDVVLPDGIPLKGRVLTHISAFWFDRLGAVVPHHCLSIAFSDFPEPFRNHADQFDGRSMLVRKARPLPVECVARGYLAGSGWTDYRKTGTVCGHRLPAGLKESDRLPEPLFTPSSKAARGHHDENITFDDVVRMVGGNHAEQLRAITLRLYREGSAYAESRGLIIADTKFEFGLDAAGHLLWIDEALTPDSSRFWPRDRYTPGGGQPSFDKQYVRDHLIAVGWNRQPPAPRLPRDVIETTSGKYVEALRLLTGRTIHPA